MRNRKKTVSIDVDWKNKDSIKCGEIAKEYLENNNYKLLSSFGGNDLSTFIYGKIKGGLK